MTAAAQRAGPIPGPSRFGALSDAEKSAALSASHEVTETLYPGVDLTEEIAAVKAQRLGNTSLLEGGGGLAAFALRPTKRGRRRVCCYIGFGAVRASPAAEQNYRRLLDACEALAISVTMLTVLAGSSLARHEAYQHLDVRGFRTAVQGV